MQIFILARDPAQAAEYLCDKHLNKMTLESAQMLCNAFHPDKVPYERTHYNNACSLWARQTTGNFLWLYLHGRAIAKEYRRRYGKVHASAYVLERCSNMRGEAELVFPNVSERTGFVCRVPKQYILPGQPVASYRRYYAADKARFAKWGGGRVVPPWWKKYRAWAEEREKQIYEAKQILERRR